MLEGLFGAYFGPHEHASDLLENLVLELERVIVVLETPLDYVVLLEGLLLGFLELAHLSLSIEVLAEFLLKLRVLVHQFAVADDVVV